MDINASLAGLINLGAVGVIAVWLMTRVEQRLDRLEQTMERVARALLVNVLAQETTAETVKHQARAVLLELEENGAGRPRRRK